MLTLLCAVSSTFGQEPPIASFAHAGRGSADAVKLLLSRTLPGGEEVWNDFELEIVTACSSPPPKGTRSKLCFELSTGSKGAGTISVKGTSGVELARGVAHYFRTRCNSSFAWPRTGGNQITLPVNKTTGETSFPAVDGIETRYRTVEYAYFQNVVESSYTFAFYSWSDWEKLIDWQALTGINLGLAYTGQEEIYRKTFSHFGVNDTAFGNWTNGPAWLAWSRGQSMHGVGSGGVGMPDGIALSRSWMAAQHALQIKILRRMRDLGIVPILPAFQGNVPPIMKEELFPTANISVQGGGRHYAAWLDGTDPLFAKIADVYMKTMCADFGCQDHWYEADGYFAAGRPPWFDAGDGERERAIDDSTSDHDGGGGVGRGIDKHEFTHASHYAAAAASDSDALQFGSTGGIFSSNSSSSSSLGADDKLRNHRGCCCGTPQCSAPTKPTCCSCCPPAPIDPNVVANARTHATAAYTGMNRTDPDAIWYYQGWILGGEFSYIKGLTSAVKQGHIVISDMWCEAGGGIWKTNGGFSFFGAPFIWGVLHNFGGNVGMWGSAETLNSGPFDAYANASSVAGVGMFPEGIDQNSPYYTLLFDVGWETTPFRLAAWWSTYALQRYGVEDANATKAWQTLGSTVYGTKQNAVSMYGEKARDGVTSYMFSGDEEAIQPDWFDVAKVSTAWQQLVEFGSSAHFEGGAQLPETLTYDIANVGREVLAKISSRMFNTLRNATTAAKVAAAGAALKGVAADVDALLCSDFGFTLGWWIEAALKLGSTQNELMNMEWSARAQVSTWLPACEPSQWPTPSGNVSHQVTGTCGTRSDLADYSNKQWGGLVSAFYSPRQQCYVEIVKKRGLPVSSGDADYNTCLDKVAWDFQHDFGGKRAPVCGPDGVGSVVNISLALLAKYEHEIY